MNKLSCKKKSWFCLQKLKKKILLYILFSITLYAHSNESYELILDNFQQISENELHFDVILQNTGAAFFLNNVQMVIEFNQHILPENGFFDNSGLNIISESSDLFYPPKDQNFYLSTNNDGLVLLTGEPLLEEVAQEISTDDYIRIARLQVIVFYKDARGAFSDVAPNLTFRESSSFALKCPVDENGRKTGIAEHLNGRQLINNIPNRSLAGHCFSGIGNWSANNNDDNYIHWNAHPETHQDFAFNLPQQYHNVIITGTALILSGETVTLKADIDELGGRLTIIKPPSPQYQIMLVANGFNARVRLLDAEYNELDNPTFADAGTVFYLQAITFPGSGEFLNWTDQYGNVLSTSSMFGPYEMPAADMEITANWSSGSKTVDGAGVEYQNAGLVIEPGGSLTVDTIYNDHEAGAEAIVLQSTAGDDATGSLIHQNQGVGATVERFIDRWPAESPWHGWHLISSPVEAMPIRPEFVPVGEDGTIPPWVDFYKWDEAHVQDHEGEMLTGWWINSKLSGGIWNPEFEDNFQTGRGYLMAYGPQSKGVVRSFMGELEVSDVPVTNLTHTGEGDDAGWHLLGNPFASALDWTRGDWQRANIIGGPKIWHETYASYTPVIDIIPAMNGFMVHTSGDGSLTMPAGARVHDITGWYKSGGVALARAALADGQATKRFRGDSGTIPHIRLTAFDPVGQTAQETVILQRPEATEGLDPVFDTPFMPGYAPEFYTISEHTPLALNNHPELYDGMIIPMGFKKNASSEFYIALSANIGNTILYLEDRIANKMHLLNETPVVHFTSLPGDPVQRFRLHINPDQSTLAGEAAAQEHPVVFAYQNTIYVHTRSEIITIRVMDLHGRLLKHRKLYGSGHHTINSTLPKGIYIIRLFDGQGVMTKQLML